MTASDDELAYYRAVEDFFSAVRGVPHLLSPKDFHLLRGWWQESVPLTAVTGGISEVFARRRERGDDDPVVSLSYCRHAVMRNARRLQEMRTGLQDGGLDGAPAAPGRSAADVVRELRAAASSAETAAPAVAAALEAIAHEVQSGADLPAALLEERLFALESLLLARCWRAISDSDRAAIERTADEAAASSGATGEARERTRRAVRDRELRRRLALPRLELG